MNCGGCHFVVVCNVAVKMSLCGLLRRKCVPLWMLVFQRGRQRHFEVVCIVKA